jgi:hypothetical protein
VYGRRRPCVDSSRHSSRKSLSGAPYGRQRRVSWRRHRISLDAVDIERRVAHVRVVDPCHPLFGSCLPISDRLSGRGPGLIVVLLPDGRERSIARSATDLVLPADASPLPLKRQIRISVRSLLPLANHVRVVLASRHEDFEGGLLLDQSPSAPDRGMPDAGGSASSVDPASHRDAAATRAAGRPSSSAPSAGRTPGSGGTS